MYIITIFLTIIDIFNTYSNDVSDEDFEKSYSKGKYKKQTIIKSSSDDESIKSPKMLEDTSKVIFSPM